MTREPRERPSPIYSNAQAGSAYWLSLPWRDVGTIGDNPHFPYTVSQISLLLQHIFHEKGDTSKLLCSLDSHYII